MFSFIAIFSIALTIMEVNGCYFCEKTETCVAGSCVQKYEEYCSKDYDCGKKEMCIDKVCKSWPEGYCEKDEDCGDHLYCEGKECKKPAPPYTKYFECLRKKGLAEDDDPILLKAC